MYCRHAPSRYSSRAVFTAARLSSSAPDRLCSPQLLGKSTNYSISADRLAQIGVLDLVLQSLLQHPAVSASRHVETIAQMNNMYTSPLTHAPPYAPHAPHQCDAVPPALHSACIGSMSPWLHRVSLCCIQLALLQHGCVFKAHLRVKATPLRLLLFNTVTNRHLLTNNTNKYEEI